MMKKIALLVVFAMLIGTTPIYAASSNNTTTTILQIQLLINKFREKNSNYLRVLKIK